MATKEEFAQTLTDIKDKVTNIAADVVSLQGQIAALVAGQVLTQEELDELNTTAQSIKDDLTIVDAMEPPVTPTP